MQEQSSSIEIDDLKEQLQSSEATVANLQNDLQQRDLELETLTAKVRNNATPITFCIIIPYKYLSSCSVWSYFLYSSK